MLIEEEIQSEIRKLEKLHKKIVDIIILKKKKEKELHMLRGDEEDKEMQTSLAQLFGEKI